MFQSYFKLIDYLLPRLQTLMQQLLNQPCDLLCLFIVETACRMTGKSGMHPPHSAISTQEHRGGPGVQISSLRKVRLDGPHGRIVGEPNNRSQFLTIAM